MPLSDSRTWGKPQERTSGKKPLGKRDRARVDTDALLDELRDGSVQIVASVLSVGGAIQFGSTRDRGAMLVRAWMGGDQYEDYVTSVAEYVATLEALSDIVEALKAQGPRP